MGKDRDHWSANLLMTYGSTLSVVVEGQIYAPLDYIAVQGENILDKWFVDGTVEDQKLVLDQVKGETEISSQIEMEDGVNKFLYAKRVYLGMMVSPESQKMTTATINFYRHITQINAANSTKFVTGTAEFPVPNMSVLQVTAPALCTNNDTTECLMTVVLQPRWLVFLLLVVIPVILVSVGLVVGLIALKALHVKQMVAYMRKKANEEGVSLEEGKSKDIHTEKLDEGAAEGEAHAEGESHPEETEEEHKDESGETSGAAVLTSGPDGGEGSINNV